MAQIWPKFGRILPPQHFPPLCHGLGGEGEIAISPKMAALRPDWLFQPSNCLLSWNSTIKSKDRKGIFWSLKPRGHLILHIHLRVIIRCLFAILVSRSTESYSFDTQLFLFPYFRKQPSDLAVFCRKHWRWDLGHCQAIWAHQTAALRMLRKYQSKYH